MRYFLSCLLFSASALVLIGFDIDVVGGVTHSARFIDPHPDEQFDPNLLSLKKEEDFVEYLRRVGKVRPREIFEEFTKRFVHGDAQHTPQSDLFLGVLGILNQNISHVRDHSELYQLQHGLSCDQQAFLLARVFQNLGYEARVIGLRGHVVTEVYFNGQWVLADPDFEIWGEGLPVRKLLGSSSIPKSLGYSVEMQEFFKSHDGELQTGVPWFNWKSNVLYQVDRYSRLRW